MFLQAVVVLAAFYRREQTWAITPSWDPQYRVAQTETPVQFRSLLQVCRGTRTSPLSQPLLETRC